MRAALQLFEHLLRLRPTGRFAKQLCARVNECVRAKHEGIRNPFRNRARLAIGVELTKLARGQLFAMHLRDIARHNAKLQSHLTQYFRAAWRARSKDQAWQVHSTIDRARVSVNR